MKHDAALADTLLSLLCAVLATVTNQKKPKGRLHDVGGEKLTIQQMAARVGVAIETMRWRMRTRTAEQALALGPPDRTRRAAPCKLRPIGDEKLTTEQLAKRAGCTTTAMYERLRKHTPAEAVALGPTGHRGARPSKFYDVGGENLIARQMAERAGCSIRTMMWRLQSYSPADAVAMGAARAKRPAAEPIQAAAPLPPAAPRAAAKRVRAREVAQAAEAPKKPQRAAKVGQPPKRIALDPSAPIIGPMPKPIVAAPARGRYDVDQVPSTFGRIGQLEDTGSAVSRAYGGGAL